MKTFLKSLFLIGFAFCSGCKERPQATMIGDYVSTGEPIPNVVTTLRVTSDTIEASSGGTSGTYVMTAPYKVIRVGSNTVTVELGQPDQPKRNMDIQVQNDSLLFSDEFFVGGKTWKRK
jgi:hypothetical protein